MRTIIFSSRAALLLGALAAAGAFALRAQADAAGPLDEAQQINRDVASFPQAKEDYFHDIDNGVAMSPEEVQGRNMWLVWTGGNDRFWDKVTRDSLATFDLLKIVTSHPGQTYCDGKHCDRDTRWNWLGAINEPCFDKPTAADPQRFGLWLDVRRKECPADPFEDEKAYPGVKIGARGTTFSDGSKLPVGSYFGYPTGIVGLRLFPNPDFDQAAKNRWDPEKYYTDENYYKDPNLTKPYRVGMSCGFCHVGPSPIDPPKDPENPEWKNLSSNPGAQYFWIDRIFFWNPKRRHENFIYQLFHTSLPGSLDTSLVSSDNINNPRTMNAVYSIAARLKMAKFHPEKLTGQERRNKQFNDYERTKILSDYFQSPDTVLAPHVLKDGADSVGVLGALNRVYLNIGLFSAEWLLHFKPLIGNTPGKRITPIEIAVLEKNSTYWNANVAQTPDVALFFLASARPDHLEEAPGGKAHLTKDIQKLDRGKIVFA